MKTFYENFVEEFKNMPFIKDGLYFGYPPCCIFEFVEFVAMSLKDKQIRDSRGVRKLHGTGYIPCANCNKKSEAELLDYIEKHRTCDLPFPEQYEEIG